VRHSSEKFCRGTRRTGAYQYALRYPADTAIDVILDIHSPMSRARLRAGLLRSLIGRFTFTFTPTHGSWLDQCVFDSRDCAVVLDQPGNRLTFFISHQSGGAKQLTKHKPLSVKWNVATLFRIFLN
jgi:hypothetical protein